MNAVTPHFFDEMRAANISAQDVIECLQAQSTGVSKFNTDDMGRKSVLFVGQKIVIAYNPTTETLVTTWSDRRKIEL